MRAVVDECPNLASGGLPVEIALGVEKSIKHGVDPAWHAVLDHCASSRAASYTLIGNASNPTATRENGW
jgi:hypothetical protein